MRSLFIFTQPRMNMSLGLADNPCTQMHSNIVELLELHARLKAHMWGYPKRQLCTNSEVSSFMIQHLLGTELMRHTSINNKVIGLRIFTK